MALGGESKAGVLREVRRTQAEPVRGRDPPSRAVVGGWRGGGRGKVGEGGIVRPQAEPRMAYQISQRSYFIILFT